MNERTIFKEVARSERAAFEFVERCHDRVRGCELQWGCRFYGGPTLQLMMHFVPLSFREKLGLVKSKLHNHLSTKGTCSFHLLAKLRNIVSTVYVQFIYF
jgi:hypothetical protein